MWDICGVGKLLIDVGDDGDGDGIETALIPTYPSSRDCLPAFDGNFIVTHFES